MGFGTTEILIVLVIILIVFGAGKLPKVMADLGKGVKSFKNAMDEDDSVKKIDDTPSVVEVEIVSDDVAEKKATPVKAKKAVAKKKASTAKKKAVATKKASAPAKKKTVAVKKKATVVKKKAVATKKKATTAKKKAVVAKKKTAAKK